MKNILSLILVLCVVIIALTLMGIIHVPLFYPYAGVIICSTILLRIMINTNIRSVQ
ncbi:hypothetical protein MKY08_09305 [Lysinibacillus sp. FSL M8-0337]|uniref:Uncharacterized protein n=1 Tax=Lysinibacillus sphaericus TaxID=1421 RepID=A0A2S5D0V7_LYSSH|nr:hypothetical protein [Lysinibacillus sphaericus]POZ56703.1 hypothetical protein LYSIN_01486 [Lysinibacillus sphaericus]